MHIACNSLSHTLFDGVLICLYLCVSFDLLVFHVVSKFLNSVYFTCLSVAVLDYYSIFLLNQVYNAIRAACCISSRSIQSLCCSLMAP